MCLDPRLYVAGTRSGWRGLGRVAGNSRKEFSVRISQPPLCVSLGCRANDTAAYGESEREDRDEPCDDDWCVEHGFYLDWRKPREDVADLNLEPRALGVQGPWVGSKAKPTR